MDVTPTIDALLRRSYERYADLVALRGGGQRLTYGELGSLVRRAATGLAELGLKAGDRVVTLAANSVEYVIVDQACFVCGFVRVGLHRRLNPHELPSILATAQPKLLRSPSRRGMCWRQTVHVWVIGLSYQGNIGLKSRTLQPQRPMPPGQHQPQLPHTAELAICD